MTTPNHDVPSGAVTVDGSGKGLTYLSTMTEESARKIMRTPIDAAYTHAHGNFFQNFAVQVVNFVTGIANAFMQFANLFKPPAAQPVEIPPLDPDFEPVAFAAGQIFESVSESLGRMGDQFDEGQEALKARIAEIQRGLSDLGAELDALDTTISNSQALSEKITSILGEKMIPLVEKIDGATGIVQQARDNTAASAAESKRAADSLKQMVDVELPKFVQGVQEANEALVSAQAEAGRATSAAQRASDTADDVLAKAKRAASVSQTLTPFVFGTNVPEWAAEMAVVSGGYKTTAGVHNASRTADQYQHVNVDDSLVYSMTVEATTPSGNTSPVYVFIQTPEQNGSSPVGAPFQSVVQTFGAADPFASVTGTVPSYVNRTYWQLGSTGGSRKTSVSKFRFAAGTTLARVGRIVAPVGTIIHSIKVGPDFNQAVVDQAQNTALRQLTEVAERQAEINDLQAIFNNKTTSFITAQQAWNELNTAFVGKTQKFIDAQAEFNAGQVALNRENKSFAQAMTEFVATQKSFNAQTLEFQKTQKRVNEAHQALFTNVTDTLATQASQNSLIQQQINLSRVRNGCDLYIPPNSSTDQNSRTFLKGVGGTLNFAKWQGDIVGCELVPNYTPPEMKRTRPQWVPGTAVRLLDKGVWDVRVSATVAVSNRNSGQRCTWYITVYDETGTIRGRKYRWTHTGDMWEVSFGMTVPAFASGYVVCVDMVPGLYQRTPSFNHDRAIVGTANWSQLNIRHVSDAADPRVSMPMATPPETPELAADYVPPSSGAGTLDGPTSGSSGDAGSIGSTSGWGVFGSI